MTIKYLVNSEIDEGNCIRCNSDYMEAKNEKELIMNWVHHYYKYLKTLHMDKIIFLPFKLEIQKAKIIKEKRMKVKNGYIKKLGTLKEGIGIL